MDNALLKPSTAVRRSIFMPSPNGWHKFFHRAHHPLPPAPVTPMVNEARNENETLRLKYTFLITRGDVTVFKNAQSEEILIIEKKSTSNPLLICKPGAHNLSLSTHQLNNSYSDNSKDEGNKEAYIHSTFPNIKNAIHYCITKNRADWFEQLLMSGIKSGMSDDEVDTLRQKHFPQIEENNFTGILSIPRTDRFF